MCKQTIWCPYNILFKDLNLKVGHAEEPCEIIAQTCCLDLKIKSVFIQGASQKFSSIKQRNVFFCNSMFCQK